MVWLLVAIPLGVTTYRVTRDSIWQSNAQNVIQMWLYESGNKQELQGLKVFGNAMNISLSGTEDLPCRWRFGSGIARDEPEI